MDKADILAASVAELLVFLVLIPAVLALIKIVPLVFKLNKDVQEQNARITFLEAQLKKKGK